MDEGYSVFIMIDFGLSDKISILKVHLKDETSWKCVEGRK